MIDWISTLLLLAAEEQAPKESPFGSMLFPLAIIFAIGYFLLIRPQQKERKRREATLKEIKKNDRVVTIGGIIGTVANMSSDNREITLKVDDNSKITMLRSSIQGPYQKGDEEKKSSEKS